MLRIFLTLWVLGSFLPKDDFIWKGTVIDSTTGNPIPGVHVLSYHRQGISDEEGRFEIEVKIGDKVTFTHIAYEPLIKIVDHDMANIVELALSETELDEYSLHSMPSEEQLKQLILNSPYIPSQIETSFNNNTGYIKNIYRLGNHHTQNSIDNVVRKFSAGNGEATFFSSNPSMGLIGVIRSLKRHGAINNDRTGDYQYPFDIKKIRKAAQSDTTLRYSNYFDD